jgi:hypothetical protein
MTPLDVCVACSTPMIAVEPDQITHPCCDPDDTTQPVLTIDEIAELLGDLDWLRRQPGRCTSCGYHPATQGHGAGCDTVGCGGLPLRPTQPVQRLRRTRQPSRSADTRIVDGKFRKQFVI